MIPKFKLSANEQIWLEEAWRLLLRNNEKPSYRTLRLNTIGKTGDDFDPRSIHKWLIADRATEITFLGLLHIADEKPLRDGERILLLIKKKLKDADHNGVFSMSELALELSFEVGYAKILFALLTEFGNVYNGASSSSQPFKGKFDYEEYRMESDEVLDAYLSFMNLETKIGNYYKGIGDLNDLYVEDSKTIGNRKLWLDQNGILQFNDLIINGRDQRVFISQCRIKELITLKSRKYDFLKLLNLCKEINFNFLYGNYYSVALLARAVIDHVPPIFECQNFKEVTNNYKSEKNSQSFKKSMIHLDSSLRNIGDSSIHSQIRKSEVTPNEIQIDFKNDLDVLLAEIIRITK